MRSDQGGATFCHGGLDLYLPSGFRLELGVVRRGTTLAERLKTCGYKCLFDSCAPSTDREITVAVSQTAEYALRAVIRLAQHPGEAQTTQQLAEATLVPQSYLPKVLQPLARAGVVSAQRGSHGGYTLSRNPSSLSVLDVVNCVDPFRRIDHCPGKHADESHRLCGLHQLLDDELADTERRYRGTTIEQLLHPPGDIPPLCVAEPDREPTIKNGHSACDSTNATSISRTE